MVSDSKDVANSGLVRPPFVYLGSIAVGLLAHFVWPMRLVSPSMSNALGAIVTIAAVGLFVSAAQVFRAAETPLPGNLPTTTIVGTGPYRFSRNPVYLAFTTLQFGIAVWVNSLSLLIALIPAVAVMSLMVILKEERYLETRFGAEYLRYKASVRRWL